MTYELIENESKPTFEIYTTHQNVFGIKISHFFLKRTVAVQNREQRGEKKDSKIAWWLGMENDVKWKI